VASFQGRRYQKIRVERVCRRQLVYRPADRRGWVGKFVACEIICETAFEREFAAEQVVELCAQAREVSKNGLFGFERILRIELGRLFLHPRNIAVGEEKIVRRVDRQIVARVVRKFREQIFGDETVVKTRVGLSAAYRYAADLR